MPDFIAETDTPATTSSLHSLLRLPYPKAAEKFLKAALDLKDKVVKETWVNYGRRAQDPTLYTGALGTAFLLLTAYRVTDSRGDLGLCAEIVASCDSVSQGSQ